METHTNHTPADFEIRVAARYLAAFDRQAGTSRTVGCGFCSLYRFLPAWAFEGLGPMWWGEAGRRAAERVLVAAAAKMTA